MTGAAVFLERYDDLSAGAFDSARDDRVCARARERGVAEGIDNLDGEPTVFQVVATPAWRENLFSARTGSFARQRSIVAGLGLVLFDRLDATLPDVAREIAGGRRTLMAEGYTPVAQRLAAACPQTFVRSEYFGAGTEHDHPDAEVINLDLQRIALPDDSFDLIVTSGVMEHVADAEQAEAEIVRILRPGGTLLFAIPFEEQRTEDVILAEIQPDGTLVHHDEPRYHLDPLRPEGALVFRQFSHAGMHERFTRLGCAFETYRIWSEELGLIGPRVWLHTARKPPR